MTIDTATFRIPADEVDAFRFRFDSVHAHTVEEVGIHGWVHIDDNGLITVRRRGSNVTLVLEWMGWLD